MSYGLLTGLGGSLYLLPNDFSISHAGTYALWRYDPDQDSWTQCADLPEALSSASMTVFDGKLYVYGEAGETMGRWLLVLSATTRRRTPGLPMTLPACRFMRR